MNRLDATEPEAVPFIVLIALVLLAYALYRIAKHVTRKRNRWLPDPKPDERDSVRQFKQMHRR
jgi:Na+-transporting methylmalonyl-CoA/oxaloacetate decarboxylase gamma subunit